ncbi:MAG: hypothetical protein HEQ24_15995 [Dolichospermum sp. BR01]|nr:hypothetical protein [Dolichospermum sp. BR01]
MLVGAKHLEDKLSVIAKNSSPNASPVQWLVGAKHLEDKLSVIAKNSSPNASPVQWSLAKIHNIYHGISTTPQYTASFCKLCGDYRQ